MLRAFILLILTASSVLGATDDAQKLRFKFLDTAGKAIPADRIQRFHCRDMTDEPIPARVVEHDGYVTVVLPGQRFQVCAMLDVPGFGEVAVYADGNGKGYSKPGMLDFVKEAAATRLLRVTSALKQAKSQGVRMPKEFADKLSAAGKKPPYESLAMTLAAGEELAVARARHRIAQWKGDPRKGFIFGCNAFGYPLRGPIYQAKFREVFNLGITNVYLSHFAPTETTRNYDRNDNETNWLFSNG
ncbi:MAG: hypothetical protein NTU88_02745, partial [Armatimonadetes bacterium]|nr:hypothetical protein [Armatimonadota bacterium]